MITPIVACITSTAEEDIRTVRNSLPNALLSQLMSTAAPTHCTDRVVSTRRTAVPISSSIIMCTVAAPLAVGPRANRRPFVSTQFPLTTTAVLSGPHCRLALPASAQISVEIHKSQEFVQLGLNHSQFRIEIVGFIRQHFQVAGAATAIAYFRKPS